MFKGLPPTHLIQAALRAFYTAADLTTFAIVIENGRANAFCMLEGL